LQRFGSNVPQGLVDLSAAAHLALPEQALCAVLGNHVEDMRSEQGSHHREGHDAPDENNADTSTDQPVSLCDPADRCVQSARDLKYVAVREKLEVAKERRCDPGR